MARPAKPDLTADEQAAIVGVGNRRAAAIINELRGANLGSISREEADRRRVSHEWIRTSRAPNNSTAKQLVADSSQPERQTILPDGPGREAVGDAPRPEGSPCEGLGKVWHYYAQDDAKLESCPGCPSCNPSVLATMEPDRPMLVAPCPTADAFQGGLLPATAVEGDGQVLAGGAAGLKHPSPGEAGPRDAGRLLPMPAVLRLAGLSTTGLLQAGGEAR